MSDRDEFLAEIKKMWIGIGRSVESWDAVHDWDYYFRQGIRADDAHIAFQDALRCE